MTARTTTLRGADARRYYVEDQLGYYLDRGEPPGIWDGRGADRLGLTGAIEEDDFLDLMAGVDPVSGLPLGTRHTDRTVRGYDVTCSAPKSVSVLFALRDDAVLQQVLDAHDAAVATVVDWIDPPGAQGGRRRVARRCRARRVGVDDGTDQRRGRGAQHRGAAPPARRW